MFWVLGARAEIGQVHVLTLLGGLGALAGEFVVVDDAQWVDLVSTHEQVLSWK